MVSQSRNWKSKGEPGGIVQIEGKENSLQALDEQPDAEFKVIEH